MKKTLENLKKEKIKIRKEIDLSTQPVNVSLEDMDKFKEKETMKKISIRKNTC